MVRAARPMGVTLLSAWYLITGLIQTVWSLLVTVFGVALICFVPGMALGGIWSLITGILNVILGVSLFSGRDWAPLVVSILAVIGIVTNVLSGINVGSIILIAINVIVLVYMQSADVKRFFATN